MARKSDTSRGDDIVDRALARWEWEGGQIAPDSSEQAALRWKADPDSSGKRAEPQN